MRQAGQSKKMAEALWSFRVARPFWSGIWNSRTLWNTTTMEVWRQYAREPPTRLTIERIRDKFETHGTVREVHKGRSGAPRTASPASSAKLLEQFIRSPQKSTKQCAREIGVGRTSIRRILKTARWKGFIPRLFTRTEWGRLWSTGVVLWVVP